MEFLKQHQLDIMLVLSGICGIIAIFVLVTRTITKMRKLSLVLMEVGSMMLLIADRYAYIYRGDTSSLGYWMVRISNFFVYFMLIFVINAFNFFLIDVYRNEGNLKKNTFKAPNNRNIVGAWRPFGCSLSVHRFVLLFR